MTIRVWKDNNASQMQYNAKFESHMSNTVLVVEECPPLVEGVPNPQLPEIKQVMDMLTSDTGIGGSGQIYYRAKVGYALERKITSSFEIATPATEYGRWIVRNIVIVPDPAKAYMYRITITETNMGRHYYNGDPNDVRGDIDFSLNTTATGKRQRAWRMGNLTYGIDARGPSIYNDGTDDLILEWCEEDWKFCDSSQDIGGGRVDLNGGVPLDVITRQQQITFEYVVRTQVKEWNDTFVTPYVNSSGNSPYLMIGDFESFIGRRNWDNLGVYEYGYLMITDVAVQPLHHEFKRVVVTMVYDEWKHAYQRPWTTTSGTVNSINTCDGATIPDGELMLVNMSANIVVWTQPFLEAFSFGATPAKFFNNDMWEELYWSLGANPSTYTVAPAGSCD